MSRNRSHRCLIWALLCLLLIGAPLLAQDASQQTPSADSGQSLGDVARAAREKKRTQVKITADDEKELFAAMDHILLFASKDTGLAEKGAVGRQFISRAELEKRMSERMAGDDDAQRFARGEVSLKKFGYLPRDFDLKSFLVSLMGESIAAFYDPREKKMFLLNWIPAEQQKPIMAHELTHALQDQNFNLDVWSRAGSQKDKPKDASKFELDQDEMLSARHAVLEGQAMIVYMDYLLAPTGHNMESSPDIIEPMREKMAQSDDTPLMHRAPLVLKDSLVFPYREGLLFEFALLQKGSKHLAFTGALTDPPRDTHEILHPKAYLAKEQVAVVPLPDIRPIVGSDYEIYDNGHIGELDARIFLQQFFDKKIAEKISEQWQGGVYLTVKRKNVAKPTTRDVSLLYISRWKSPAATERFAQLYQQAVNRRYTSAVLKSSVSPCSGQPECPQSFAEIGTEEGEVIIRTWSSGLVVVTESFDVATSTKLANAIFAESLKPTTNAALLPGGDLSLRLTSLPEAAIVQQALQARIAESLLAAH